jgi:hypothetical protein
VAGQGAGQVAARGKSNGENALPDTDEARRKRSEAARKANATKGREGRRQAALKALVTRGLKSLREAACKGVEARRRKREAARGAVTLGDLVGQVDRLEVRCRRCGRHGWLRLTGLIADHSAGMGLPDLAARLAAGCPRATAPDPAERCFVHFPQLLGTP